LLRQGDCGFFYFGGWFLFVTTRWLWEKWICTRQCDDILCLKGNIMKLILDFSIITIIYKKVDKSSYCIMCIDSLLNECNEEKCQFSIIIQLSLPCQNKRDLQLVCQPWVTKWLLFHEATHQAIPWFQRWTLF